MRRLRVVKIPHSATIKCPHCLKKSRLEISREMSYARIECPKCKKMIETPIMQCCVICTFSNKKCIRTLEMLAFKNKAELRETQKI